MEKNIPTELLVSIISFLPCEYVSICKNICRLWKGSLKSSLSKKTLFVVPKRLHYCKSFYGGIITCAMTLIKNEIHVSDYTRSYKININTFEKVEENNNFLRTTHMSSNDNYICINRNNNLEIFSLKMKLINIIPKKKCQGLIIDNNNNILISTRNKLYILNLEGKIINSWSLYDNKIGRINSRNIAYNKNEIFMLNSSSNHIHVFSYEGKLIRSWKGLGYGYGNLVNSCGIAIYRDTIFVADSQNYRIQAFTCCGKFIFEHTFNHRHFIQEIVISDNYVYVSDNMEISIHKFQIIYD